MKSLLLTLAIITASLLAQATELEVYQFDLIRRGGGAINIQLSKASYNQVVLHVDTCFGKKDGDLGKYVNVFLSEKSKQTDLEALAILDNKAILAEEKAIFYPEIMTGSWLSLKVSYSILEQGKIVDQNYQIITNPIVLVNGKQSNVLSEIESIAREELRNTLETTCGLVGGGATISNGN